MIKLELSENKISDLNLIINETITNNLREIYLDFSNNTIRQTESVKFLIKNQIYLK